MKKLLYLSMAALLMLTAASCEKDNVISVEGTTWRTTIQGLYNSTREHTLIFSADDNTVTWKIDGSPITGTFAYSENHEEVLLSGLKDKNYTLTKAYKSKKPGRLAVVAAVGSSDTSFTTFVFDKE